MAIQTDKLLEGLKTRMGKKDDTDKTEMIMEYNFFDDDSISSTRTEYSPEDITALKDAGLSPDQITDILKPSDHSSTPSHNQPTQIQQPYTILKTFEGIPEIPAKQLITDTKFAVRRRSIS